MFHPTSCSKFLLIAGCLSLSLGAAAASEDSGVGIYLDGGRGIHSNDSTDSLTVGVVMPWAPPQSFHGGALSFYWDFFLSQWRAPGPNGHDRHSYNQGGAIANWRYRFAEGDSPWFAEVGLGGSVMDELYRTQDRAFSTAFQFTEQLGFGRSFGAQGEHELSVRVQHFSNAGIKEPNPGETFVRLRYLYRF
jgi:lipid A 3-O-deacylase